MKKALAFLLAMVGALVGAFLSVFVTTILVYALRLGPTAMIWLAMALGSGFAVLAADALRRLGRKVFGE